MLGPCLRGLVDSFGADLYTLVSEVFCKGYIDSKFHTDTAIEGITLRFSKGAVLDDSDGFSKGRNVVDLSVDSKVIQL